MGCNCNNPINSWIDWRNADPKNPLDLIANATLNGAIGVYTLSTTYAPTGGAWAPNGWSINGSIICQALGTDNIQMVNNAAQWNFQHQTQVPYSNPAPPLQKVIVLRGGTQWKMVIPINLDRAMDNIELSFRDNAGTRGDQTGTIPVIQWTGSFPAATYTLEITLKNIGHAVMGFKGIDTAAANKPTMYESEWIIKP